jgi:hypothetical protein
MIPHLMAGGTSVKPRDIDRMAPGLFGKQVVIAGKASIQGNA